MQSPTWLRTAQKMPTSDVEGGWYIADSNEWVMVHDRQTLELHGWDIFLKLLPPHLTDWRSWVEHAVLK